MKTNKLNDLDGGQWLYRTKTLLQTKYPHELGHELRKAHGANKPPRLMAELMEIFTKRGQRVLDPFAGVGGTLLGAAAIAQREAVGIELQPAWVDIYHQVCDKYAVSPMPCHIGDCLEILPEMVEQEEQFDCIISDPPYGITLKKTMSSKTAKRQNRKTDFAMESDHPSDLANKKTMVDFLDAMEVVFSFCYDLLTPGKYALFMTRNNYINGEYFYTDAELAKRAKLYGFIPKSTINWWEVGGRLRPFGYPYAYIPNIMESRIIVLQKPALKRSLRKVA